MRISFSIAAGGVRRKLRPPPRPVGVDRLDEADAADGNEIVRLRGAAVFFDDVRDEAHIVPHEHIFGGGVACAGALKVLSLLFGRERLGKGSLAAHGARKKEDLGHDRVQEIEKHGGTPSDALLYVFCRLYHSANSPRAPFTPEKGVLCLT